MAQGALLRKSFVQLMMFIVQKWFIRIKAQRQLKKGAVQHVQKAQQWLAVKHLKPTVAQSINATNLA